MSLIVAFGAIALIAGTLSAVAALRCETQDYPGWYLFVGHPVAKKAFYGGLTSMAVGFLTLVFF